MTGHLPRRAAALTAALAATLLVAGCAGATTASPSAHASASEAISGELTIYAAASLSGAFDELAEEFAAAHPGVTVEPISYDGSSVLATQLIGGAPADVFASADEKTMTSVADEGLASSPVAFASNVLQIATAPGNPQGITDLASLTADDLTVVLCAPEVPCGNASQTLLTDAGVALTPASEEQNVTAVLTKVARGEADAGLVYVTDVKAAEDSVTGLPIEGADAATNVYPIVAMDDAPNPAAAAAFVDFVTGETGRAVLAEFGFGAP